MKTGGTERSGVRITSHPHDHVTEGQGASLQNWLHEFESHRGLFLSLEIIINQINIVVGPFRCGEDGKISYWASLYEDSADGYGDTPEESLGSLMLYLAECYENQEMPYIKRIYIRKDVLTYPKEAGRGG